MKLAVAYIAPAGIVVFTEVAEYLYAALRALDHDVVLCKPNAFAHDGRVNIILGNNILDHPDVSDICVPPGSVFWNFEQATPRWMDAVHEAVLRYRPAIVWDWSADGAAAWRARGVRAVHVPLGYVPEMVRIPRVRPQSIDVLFLGSVSERRRQVLLDCFNLGLRVHRGRGAWGHFRDVLTGASKVVLNMHFYEREQQQTSPAFEIVRVLPLLANGMAVVSERGYGHDRFEGGVHFVDDIRDMARACHTLVRDDELRGELELRAAQTARLPQNDARELLRAPLEQLARITQPFAPRALAV